MRKYIMALSGAASLLTLGLAGAQASVAEPRATAACGIFCFNLSSEITGSDVIQNAYIPGGNGVAINAKVGTILNLKLGNNSYTQEDFTPDFTGLTVSDFCTIDPPADSQEFDNTSYICIHYSSDPVYEANWSPDGNQSGLCVGVFVPNVAGQHAVLIPCGVDTRTLWIADDANATGDATPWINGSDANFTHPLVLTVNTGTSRPQNQLFLQRLNLLTGGNPNQDQLFELDFGMVV